MSARRQSERNPGFTLFVGNRHLLLLTLVLVLVAGFSALGSLPRIEDPRITTRNATIITTLPGAGAERVEALVTKNIEDQLRELSEIKTIDSTSRAGISVIAIELQDWVTARDNEEVFSKVRDKLADAQAELPNNAGVPQLDDKRGAVAYSLVVSLSWKDGSPADLGILGRQAEILGDRLRNLPGTEQLVYFGAPEEEILVTVDPAELAALRLTPAALAERLTHADVKQPAGTVRTVQRDLGIEILGELDSVSRIAQVPLAENGLGGVATVGDVAQVRKQARTPPEQIALDDGRRAVLIAVRTEENIRLDHWAERARAALEKFREGLDPAMRLETVFDQSSYTRARLGNLSGTLLAGAGVVVLVVWFTMGWRPALIVGSALPLSAAASLFGLTFFGEQIHQMSIFGMIIAIGLLIDNAIVMTDAVLERLRRGATPTQAVSGAIRHLFSPLFASTFTTILGFMPIFLLPGNIGDFVGPIAIAVVLALIASFALSMSVIPALAALFARPAATGVRHWWRQGVHTPGLASAFRGLLHVALKRPLSALALVSAPPIIGFVLAGQLGMQFFPPADRDQLEVQVWLPAGSGILHTAGRVGDIEAAIHETAGVRRLTWVAGASSPPVYYNQLREQDSNPAYARGVVRVDDGSRAKALVMELQQRLSDRFPDAQIVVKAFGQGPPIKAPIGFRIIGADLHLLRAYGEKLRGLMHQIPEITHTQASILGGEPKLWLEADEVRARLAGLSLAEIAGQFHSALEGSIGGQVLEDLEELPVRIRYDGRERGDLDRVSALHLQSASTQQWIPANALGELALRPELAGITRRNGERINEITAFLRPGTLPIEITKRILSRLESEDLGMAPGYRLEVAGDSAEQESAVGQLLTYVPVLGVLMIASLVLSFRSFALAGLIGVVAVFSVGLGMLSLWAGGFPLGFNPLIGSAGLIGVAINGSIVVLAAIRANPRSRAGSSEAIIGETLSATRHIVSTTLTTVAGFMPLLIYSSGDFWPPLAIVIAGGVGLSIGLSLLFTPVAYGLMARKGLLAAGHEASPDRPAGGARLPRLAHRLSSE